MLTTALTMLRDFRGATAIKKCGLIAAPIAITAKQGLGKQLKTIFNAVWTTMKASNPSKVRLTILKDNGFPA